MVVIVSVFDLGPPKVKMHMHTHRYIYYYTDMSNIADSNVKLLSKTP